MTADLWMQPLTSVVNLTKHKDHCLQPQKFKRHEQIAENFKHDYAWRSGTLYRLQIGRR